MRYGVDIIIAGDYSAAKAARQATSRLPIVFVSVDDPVGAGLVKSIARPGGNATGLTDLDRLMSGKRLEVFRQLVPGLKRVVYPYNVMDVMAVAKAEAYRDAARRLGIELVERPLRTQEEARVALTRIRKGDVDGILSPRNPDLNIMGFLLELTSHPGIPTMFSERFMVEEGGLAGYGPSFYEAGRLAARMVDKIIKGVKPAEIPVEVDPNIEFSINLKVAKALGISIAPEVLYQADRLIR